MPGRFLRTLLILMTLGGLYLPYAFAVRMLVDAERPTVAVPPTGDAPLEPRPARPPDESSRIAREYLTEHPWAADANMQLRDPGRLFYYTETWEQSEDLKSITFTPLAIVSFGEEQKEPLIIVADSAVLRFAGPVEPGESKFSRIIGGTLKDDVIIQGPDDLELRGRQFTFSESSGRLWSDHPVDLKWQQSSGRADRVQVDLEMAKSNGARQPLAISHVREIHLIRNVEMNLQVEQKDGPTIPLDVTCDGRFRCQLLGGADDPASNSIGTFEDNVVVLRTISPGVQDRLTCRKLDLYLNRVDDTAAQDGTAGAESLTSSEESGSLLEGADDFQLRRMVASGDLILMESSKDQLIARIGVPPGAPPIPTTIDYEFDQQRVVLNKFDPAILRKTRPDRLPRVLITQPEVRMNCLQVELRHDRENQLREVFCRGDGKLTSWKAIDQVQTREQPRSPQTIPVPVLTAEWTKQLRRYSDRETGHDVIDLSGDAVVRMPQERSGVSADYIKVWMDPLRRPDADDDDSEPASEPRPHRILALDNVTLISPEMQGRMAELQIWFEDAEPVPSESQRTLQPVSLRVPATSTSRRPAPEPDRTSTGQFQVADGPPAATIAPAPLPDDLETPKDPVLVSARLARIRMLRRGPDVDPEVAEVWTEGDVYITQRDDLGRTAVLQGDRLHVVNRSETDQVVHMFGQPASVSDPKMNLSGEEIMLDRSQNLVWVDGRGTMTLPIDRDFDGNALPIPTELTISWLEQMMFDGLAAQFVGSVHARQKNEEFLDEEPDLLQNSEPGDRVPAAERDNVLSCQQMKVTMASPVSFQNLSDSSDDQPPPEVSGIVCDNDVELSSHQMEKGGLKSVSRARFARFAINNDTGRVEATGPGVLATWTRGKGKRARLAPLGSARANSGGRAESSGWEYTRIGFVRDMIGQMQNRSAKFRGQVTVVYGPVSEPLEKIDIEKLPKDGGVMSCRELEFSQLESGLDGHDSPSITLLATGNARLEGQTFHALADEISYDESKGLYMLKSFGDRESMLWRESQPGGERTAVVTRTIRFNPSLNSFGLDRARRLQGIQ